MLLVQTTRDVMKTYIIHDFHLPTWGAHPKFNPLCQYANIACIVQSPFISVISISPSHLIDHTSQTYKQAYRSYNVNAVQPTPALDPV